MKRERSPETRPEQKFPKVLRMTMACYQMLSEVSPTALCPVYELHTIENDLFSPQPPILNCPPLSTNERIRFKCAEQYMEVETAIIPSMPKYGHINVYLIEHQTDRRACQYQSERMTRHHLVARSRIMEVPFQKFINYILLLMKGYFRIPCQVVGDAINDLTILVNNVNRIICDQANYGCITPRHCNNGQSIQSARVARDLSKEFESL